jgi:hypothetical protein
MTTTNYLNDRLTNVITEKKSDVIIMDNSSLTVFETCQRAFLYRVLLSLHEKTEKVEMTFGTAFHKFLELYHAETYTFDECFEGFCRSAFKTNSKIAATRQLAIDSGVLQEYSAEFGFILCKKYKEHHPLEKEYFTILRDSENKPYTETGFAIDLPNGIVIGLIDGIGKINLNNKIIVIDHKTTKSLLNDKWKSQFNPNNQISKYLHAASEYFGQPINTALINGIRVKDYKRGDPKENSDKLFDRVETERSDEQLKRHAFHVNYQLKQISQSIKEGVDGFPMETNSCNGKYSECEYKRICMSKSDYMIQLMTEGSYDIVKWSPYEIFEDSETQKIVEIELKENLIDVEKIEVKKKDEYLFKR